MQCQRKQLNTIYQRLFGVYSSQNWWPADSPFEVMVGAILTQNTAWKNVVHAIQNLKQNDSLNAQSIINLPDATLATLIRSSGYFNVKTRRLKNYTRWFVNAGCFNSLHKLDDLKLRDSLLSVNGIGPETADDILLYAFERPVFIIDTYTRRLFSKLGLIKGDEPYESLRRFFESALRTDQTAIDIEQFKEYHALIVRHAKEPCSGIDTCKHCYVEAVCAI